MTFSVKVNYCTLFFVYSLFYLNFIQAFAQQHLLTSIERINISLTLSCIPPFMQTAWDAFLQQALVTPPFL